MYMLLVLLVFAGGIRTEATLDALYGQLGATCAELNVFSCRNSRCVPKEKVCDGQNDCLDNSDEEDCGAWKCSDKEFFRCKNQLCVSRVFVCDGDNDCGDFSDETDCANSGEREDSRSGSCDSDEWMCADKKCIAKDFVCNGEMDCVDGSDESTGCIETENNCSTFKCSNGVCIPNEWRCDGVRDCGDGDDEKDCQEMISPAECTTDKRMFLCANNHTCIKMEKLCDKNFDCPDNSDEGVMCSSPTNTCANHNCSHDCVMMPTGPKCVCPTGYHNVDEKTCQDIDECKQYGICDQRCRNTPGSYECYCDFRYSLQPDKKTCKVSGTAVMYFSSKTEIRSYFLTTKQYSQVASNLKQVVGINSDGYHIYWTDVFSEHESIFRASDDGSNKELLVTSGLGAPEDLAVDWITGNIYFTDSEYSHIGVCSNKATYCTVLVNKDIRKPRGIVLSPKDGLMYWTDWGQPAEIARANMDGSDDLAFVSNDIYWPNGLALDYPNDRLYWVDAKKKTIESIRLDGSERMVVLEEIIRHPYAIAVFEDRIFWSDWKSHSIQSCNKFTGKNHTTLVKEKKKDIYGIHIQHSAIRSTTANPCGMAFCSHLCLIAGKGYRCVCPPHMKINPDNHTCSNVEKEQILVAGAKDVLLSISHQSLGKHDISTLPSVAKDIGAITYDDLTHSLYIYDLDSNSVVRLNLETKEAKPLEDLGRSRGIYGKPLLDIGKIEDLAFDNLGNNLYWVDSKRSTVEALNLNTMSRKVIVHDLGDEVPQSISLVPRDGIMFIAFESKSHFGVHIDRMTMDGKGRSHIIENGLVGPVKLAYDNDLHRIFFADAGTGTIESTSPEGNDRHDYKNLETTPKSITFLNREMFWTNEKSKRLYWSNKMDVGVEFSKRIKLDMPVDLTVMHIAAVTPHPIEDHPCHNFNGNCSHLCLLSASTVVCACPLGMNIKADGYTCYKPRVCDNDQFSCELSEMCIPAEFKCNGRQDCTSGEDERDCPAPNACSYTEFKCGDGKCIDEQLVCDQHYDCEDKSDEEGHGCVDAISKEKCPEMYHRCGDGSCLPQRFMCDGRKDCEDGSDEDNCEKSTCGASQFKCKSGTCIAKHWECDHEYDCQDLSDEHSGCAALTCAPDKFTCKNGRCVDVKFKCDSVDDCGDMSDESSCKAESADPCGHYEFPCNSNKTICVPFQARCNGTSECPHDEDEHGCNNCHAGDFECANKKCVPKSWVCDKTDDCGDNSDESAEACSNKTSNGPARYGLRFGDMLNLNMPCDNGYRCKYGKCIDLKLVCNGVEDCADGSDEQGSCVTACRDHNSNPCQFRCIATPSGPMCACQEGYKLNGDGKTCSDIQECSKDPMVCSQKCKELPGSFRCNCFEGFMLRGDRRSCKSLGPAMTMYFTSGSELRKLSQTDKSLTQVFAGNTATITGMDVAVRSGYIYYSIEMAGTIHRLNLENSTEEHISSMGQPKSLSVDWSTQNVYFFDADTLDKSIKVCNMNGESCTKIVTLDTHSHVSSIAVDPVNKVVFYTLIHWWVFNSPSTIIYKCRLDGSKSEELVKSFNGLVTGITYDSNKQKLYYVENSQGHLKMLNYDGTEHRLLLSNLTKPIGLSLFEDSVYSLSTSGYMTKCRLYGERRDCDTFRLNALTIENFAISQESRQPQLTNPCTVSKCSGTCIPVDVGFKCMCEDGSAVQEGEECPLNTRAANGEDRRPKFNLSKKLASSEEEKKGNGSLIAGLLVPIFLALAVLAGYLVMKKRRAGQFEISMKFVNPIYGLSRNPAPVNTGIQPGEHEYCNPIDFGSDDMQSTTNAILQRLNPLVKLDDE